MANKKTTHSPSRIIPKDFSIHDFIYTGKYERRQMGRKIHFLYYWEAKCICGKTKWICSGKINLTRSCGCQNQKYIRMFPRPQPKKGEFILAAFIHPYKNACKSGRRKYSFNLTLDEVDKLWKKQNGKCFYTGISLTIPTTAYQCRSKSKTYTASLDRIDSKKEYCLDNVVFCHKVINRMKSTFNQEEFIIFCNLVAKEHERENLEIKDDQLRFTYR